MRDIRNEIDIYGLRKRREQNGLEIEPELVDMFGDDEEYLKCLSTLTLGFIEEVKDINSYPNVNKRERTAVLYKERYEEFDSKRKKSEDKLDRGFFYTEFVDSHDLSKEERLIVDLLFSLRGVGIPHPKPFLTGEELMMALNMLFDTSFGQGRRLLYPSSTLLDKGIIQHGFRNIERSFGMESAAPVSVKVDQECFELSDRAFTMIVGDIDIAEQLVKTEPISRSRDGSVPLEKVSSDIVLDDVVLPEKTKHSVRSVVTLYEQKDRYFDEWGMKSVTGGEGMTILFTGPSGTGKSMTAKAIGNMVNRDVYKVKFEELVNCFYGETEKNVKSIFDKVNDEGAVVILDEAEAILSRRGFSHSCSDTENRIVDIFLDELEKHEGLIILTSNFASNIDKAMNRRFSLKVEFPMPDAGARERIWELHIPKKLPLGDDVDLRELASKYKMSGGQIRNAVINAARNAVTDGVEVIHQKYFQEAARDEFEDTAMNYSLYDKEEELEGYL